METENDRVAKKDYLDVLLVMMVQEVELMMEVTMRDEILRNTNKVNIQ